MFINTHKNTDICTKNTVFLMLKEEYSSYDERGYILNVKEASS